jgi:hypothetical protein
MVHKLTWAITGKRREENTRRNEYISISILSKTVVSLRLIAFSFIFHLIYQFLRECGNIVTDALTVPLYFISSRSIPMTVFPLSKCL